MTSRRLHIVLYTDAQGIGGAEISLGNLIEALSPNFKLTLIGSSQKVITAIAAKRVGIAHCILPSSNLPSFRKLLRTFYRLNPDIIHCNLCTPWACAAGLAAALLLPNSRVVRVDQLPLRTTDALQLWQTRLLSLRVDAHVAVGEASARRMEDFYALGRNSVLSIPNGVPNFFQIPPTVALLPSGEMVVGSIGRLDAMKAHDVLLRAIAQVDGVRATILGEGNQRQALETLADDLGIRDRLDLPGWVEQPSTYLPNFDVVAMPSRSEGFPLAMVEAMLAARPVVATRVGSMPEAIIDGETGLLIEKNDVMGLAKALYYLRDNPHERIKLGIQARELALIRFTAQTMAASYETLWQEIVSRPRSPRFWVGRPKD